MQHAATDGHDGGDDTVDALGVLLFAGFDVAWSVGTQVTDREYLWDPGYVDELNTAEDFASHPANAVGHQGLFFDRFDAPPTATPLTPGAEGLYYNRNRHYAPVLGRFLQRDPNETGQETLGLFYDGQAPFVASDGFNLKGVVSNYLNACERLSAGEQHRRILSSRMPWSQNWRTAPVCI